MMISFMASQQIDNVEQDFSCEGDIMLNYTITSSRDMFYLLCIYMQRLGKGWEAFHSSSFNKEVKVCNLIKFCVYGKMHCARIKCCYLQQGENNNHYVLQTIIFNLNSVKSAQKVTE